MGAEELIAEGMGIVHSETNIGVKEAETPGKFFRGPSRDRHVLCMRL